MNQKDILAFVRNDCIEFVTMRPPGSKFALLERRVVVTGSQDLVELCEKGDVCVLDDLVKILNEPDRAWAAVVLLAALTRREEKIVDSFATIPDEWWDSLGRTAYERWNSWLKEAKEKLVWNSKEKCFEET